MDQTQIDLLEKMMTVSRLIEQCQTLKLIKPSDRAELMEILEERILTVLNTILE